MILITGKNGQLGWELRRALAPLGPVTALDATELPLEDTGAIRRVIRKVRPTLVVNAARFDHDLAEKQGDLAMAVNGAAPAIIADELKRLGGGLVHFSTGFVFDGVKKTAYDEGDPPRPASVYGESRLAGEAGVRGVGLPHLIFRTSWVYGARGENFLRTTLETAAAGRPLREFNDQRGAPTWSRMVAEAAALVLAQTGAAQRPDALEDYGGTYHLSAAGETTWFEFARAILQRSPEPLDVRAAQVAPMTAREAPGRARRPANALLDCTKFTETFGFALPDWRESLDLVMEELRHE
ncbi:MAG: dTDP-4-dehydrorhamnose reductase [Candidatus Geothermincolia bacterium]